MSDDTRAEWAIPTGPPSNLKPAFHRGGRFTGARLDPSVVNGRNTRQEVPVWLAALVVALAVVAAAYVVLYGGAPTAPLAALFWLTGVAVSAFLLSLVYRFVVAVERIAEKL